MTSLTIGQLCAQTGEAPHVLRFDVHRTRLIADRASIDAALGFLEHTMDCVHPVIDNCPACAAFAFAEEGTVTSGPIRGAERSSPHGGENL